MKNNSTNIDLKQINDPDNRITIASAESIYSQITDWIQDGMNDDNNKCAALIMFSEQTDKNKLETNALNLGNGKAFMDSLTQLVINGFKTSIPDKKHRIVEALTHCARVLDSVDKYDEKDDIARACVLLSMIAITYMGDSEK